VEWFPAIGDLAFLWLILATVAIISVNRKVRSLAHQVGQLQHAANDICPTCGTTSGGGRFCRSCGAALKESVTAK
jgi:ribosomal protein L32